MSHLDAWATLVIEDGEKVACVRCMLDSDTLSIESTSTCKYGTKVHKPFVLSTRIVLDSAAARPRVQGTPSAEIDGPVAFAFPSQNKTRPELS